MSTKSIASLVYPPKTFALTLVLIFVVSNSEFVAAQNFSVLYSFTGTASDGAGPDSTLITDADGNLYGTTRAGGAHGDTIKYQGYGTAFQLTPSGSEKVLYSFTGGLCAFPSGIVWDSKGNLYGTSTGIGSVHPTDRKQYNGSVFELAHPFDVIKHNLLYRFNQSDEPSGAVPQSGLIIDTQDNLYGTTSTDGADGFGTVFQLTASGVLTVLHNFSGGSDGSNPHAGLIQDSDGNLYGTTYSGGDYGLGTVFEVSASGTESVVYSFAGGNDGAMPSAALLLDGNGNLYGTTTGGGSSNCSGGCGVVFQLTLSGEETVRYRFAGGTDGSHPMAAVVLDAESNLYGTTYSGGGSGCESDGCGTVFELTPENQETVLYRFAGGADGANPSTALLFDSQGDLFGTASAGGNTHCSGGCGTVFKITP